LLDWLGQLARERGHPDDRVTAFTEWARRFILFHGKRHPRELGSGALLHFLEHVAQSNLIR
jgi:hypothetical protein